MEGRNSSLTSSKKKLNPQERAERRKQKLLSRSNDTMKLLINRLDNIPVENANFTMMENSHNEKKGLNLQERAKKRKEKLLKRSGNTMKMLTNLIDKTSGDEEFQTESTAVTPPNKISPRSKDEGNKSHPFSFYNKIEKNECANESDSLLMEHLRAVKKEKRIKLFKFFFSMLAGFISSCLNSYYNYSNVDGGYHVVFSNPNSIFLSMLVLMLPINLICKKRAKSILFKNNSDGEENKIFSILELDSKGYFVNVIGGINSLLLILTQINEVWMNFCIFLFTYIFIKLLEKVVY